VRAEVERDSPHHEPRVALAAEGRRKYKTAVKRVATKLGALCLGVVLLELCLQALALVGSLLREARYPEIAEAEHVVLCVGDSHVYGFNVDAAAAWPAQLEELLRAAELDACVVNRGLPGKNSRTVLEELPGYLADYQPDFVLCQVGINNRHSVIPPSGAAAPPAWRSLRSAQLISIAITRLSSEPAPALVRRELGGVDASAVGDELELYELEGGREEVRMRTREGVVESFRIGGGHVGSSREEITSAMEILRDDLLEIARLSRAAGAQPVLLTYADGHADGILRAPNLALRRAHEEGSVPLVDLAEVMDPMQAEVGTERLLFADAHPRREGHALIARIVADALGGQGLLEGAPHFADPLAPLRESGPIQAELELLEDTGEELVVRCTYEPGLHYSLLLSGATDAGMERSGLTIPLLDDALFEAAAAHEATQGAFDAEGAATVRLPAELLELAGGGPIHAVLVGRTPGHAWLSASAALQLR